MKNVETNKSPVKGLRLLRTAGILSIIAVIIAIVGGVILVAGAAIGMGQATDSGTTVLSASSVGMVGIGGLIALIGGILTLIAGIMQIVGLSKNSGIHASYKNALLLVVLEIILAGVVSFLSLPNYAVNLIDAASMIAALLVVYFVISATIDFLVGNSNQALADQGKSVRTLYIVCTSVIVVANLVELIPVMATVASLISMVASIVELVALFKYIGFLGKSATALES